MKALSYLFCVCVLFFTIALVDAAFWAPYGSVRQYYCTLAALCFGLAGLLSLLTLMLLEDYHQQQRERQ